MKAHRAVWMAALPTFADFRKILCWRVVEMLRKQKIPKLSFQDFCGADGTRTRDPMRDRHVF